MVTTFNPDEICKLTALDWERVGPRLEQSDLDWIVERICAGNKHLKNKAKLFEEQVRELDALADRLEDQRDKALTDLASAEREIRVLRKSEKRGAN